MSDAQKKWRPKCKQYKPLESFTPHKAGTHGRNGYCKMCCCKISKEWRANNKEKRAAFARREWMKRKYGMTPSDYDALLREQGGLCAICRTEGKKQRKDIRYALHIDHDHRTGRVRGLLCHRCNTVLGNAGDSQDILARAMAYLSSPTVWMG